ncbi:MAG: cytochrome c oxidase subunit 3 [Planctomycetota bacterium]
METVVVESTEMRERTRLGMWLFLASEIMFFAGFIGAYVVLRTIQPAGENNPFNDLAHLNKWLALVNTVVLITSSLTMALAVGAAHRGDNKAIAKYTLFTMVLGVTFLVIKGFEYNAKFQVDHFPSTSVMYACYFTMTGFHGLHVLVGIAVLFFIWLFALRGRYSVNRNVGVEVTGLYWHLVDVIWIFLFPIIYLL